MLPTKRDFDAVAQTWDDEPRRVELSRAIAGAIRDEVPLSPTMSAMDYGAGTGLVTLLLHADLGSVVAADTSEGMLAVLDGKIAAAGIEGVSTRLLDLTIADLRPTFDLIFSAMTMHHIADTASVIRKFHAAILAGGWLALADLDAEDGSFHSDPTGIFHDGFSTGEMQAMFAAAGFVDIRTRLAHVVTRPIADGTLRDFPVLLTVGRKP